MADALKKERTELEKSKDEILSSPQNQASFIDSLLKMQTTLRAELEAQGLGIDVNGKPYLIEPEIASPGEPPVPSTFIERIRFFATGIEYMAVTTALNRVLQIYEKSDKARTDWLYEAAKVGFETVSDKQDVGVVILAMLQTGELGQDEEEVREIFLLIAASRLRRRINTHDFPRVKEALDREAKALNLLEEDVLLSEIVSNLPAAWDEYLKPPDSAKVNDFGKLRNLVVNLFIRQTKSREKEVSIEELPELAQQPEQWQQLLAKEEVRQSQPFLSDEQHTVMELKAQGLSDQEIASRLDITVDAVKSRAKRARKKRARNNPSS
jgi:DNA-binding CsgD family transcriptional regulator